MEKMVSILPETITPRALHGHLLSAVGPRPIAFASTIDKKGLPNLSPFSFFNVFSANPPILIFSPALRGSDATKKDTLLNVEATKEVVINVVNYNIVQQMSLASTAYKTEVNEFEKAGLTMLKSDLVAPFRVAESPIQFECKVVKVEPLGTEGSAGNLIFSEVVKMHITSSVLDGNGNIDQKKIDLVARMGGNWYSRAGKGLFEVPKPLATIGIGVDNLPDAVRNSRVLTGNDLGMLGNVEGLPAAKTVAEFINENEEIASLVKIKNTDKLHKKAQEYLHNNDVLSAWKVLLAN